MDGPGAYQAIWAEFDLWYGGVHRFLEQQEREIMSFTPITSDQDVHRLQQFTLLLRNLLLNTSMAGIQTGRELYLCATQKILRTLLVKYVETHDDTACDIHSFSAWTIRRLHTLRTVDERLSPRAPHTAPQTTTGALVAHTTRPPSRPTQRQASKSRKTHKSPTKPCVFCKSKHFHEDCSVYTDCHSRQQFCRTSTAACCASRPTTRHSSATATSSATTAKASSTTELSVRANFRRREHQQDTPRQLLSCRQLQRWPLQLHRRC